MMKKMGKLLALFLIVALLAGCSSKIPITEKVVDYGDGSTAYLPVVQGLKDEAVQRQINETLEQRIQSNYQSIKGDKEGNTQEGFSAFYAGDLLSVFQEGFFLTMDAKEGESYLQVFHINCKTGKFYTLGDLFKQEAGYQKRLEELAAAKLEESLGQDWVSSTIPIGSAQFDVFDEKLVLIFAPYDVAVGSYGFVDVAIPFSEMEDMLNKDGEFYQAIQKAN